MPLDDFLRGRAPDPSGGAVARLLALAPRAREEFFLLHLGSVDQWLRGRMMSAAGYAEGAPAPPEERAMEAHLAAAGAVLRAPAAPGAVAVLYRAVVAPPETLPPGGWRSLPGSTWRTGRRPLQSWTDALGTARDFARSVSGRAYAESGGVAFVVEAALPEAAVLFRHTDLARALGPLLAEARRVVPADDARRYVARTGERVAEALASMGDAQREAVALLPGGRAPVRAVHAVDEDEEGGPG